VVFVWRGTIFREEWINNFAFDRLVSTAPIGTSNEQGTVLQPVLAQRRTLAGACNEQGTEPHRCVSTFCHSSQRKACRCTGDRLLRAPRLINQLTSCRSLPLRFGSAGEVGPRHLGGFGRHRRWAAHPCTVSAS